MSYLQCVSDVDLVNRFHVTVSDEREHLVHHLDLLREMDRRQLFYAYSSLREYIVMEHGMDKATAERRIRATRFIRRFPGLRELLFSNLTNISLMEVIMGCTNREELADREAWELVVATKGMTCAEAELEIARRYPESVTLPRDTVRQLTDEYSELRCVVKTSTLKTLEEIRGFLAHSHPGIKFGELIDEFSREYRERHHPAEKARRAEDRKAQMRGSAEKPVGMSRVESPESPSDHIEMPAPARVRARKERRFPNRRQIHELTLRDGYRCSYVDDLANARCTSTHALQVDHVIPWCEGGPTEL
jgi:hypothetical protein